MRKTLLAVLLLIVSASCTLIFLSLPKQVAANAQMSVTASLFMQAQTTSNDQAMFCINLPADSTLVSLAYTAMPNPASPGATVAGRLGVDGIAAASNTNLPEYPGGTWNCYVTDPYTWATGASGQVSMTLKAPSVAGRHTFRFASGSTNWLPDVDNVMSQSVAVSTVPDYRSDFRAQLAFGSGNKRRLAASPTTFVQTMGASGTIAHSQNGEAWTQSTVSGPASTLLEVVYGEGRFVAIGDGDRQVYTSTDGVSWAMLDTSAFSGGGPTAAADIAYNGQDFAIVGYGGLAYASTDGTSWTGATIEAGCDYTRVVGGNGFFVALCVGTPSHYAYSTDGLSWTAAPFASGIWTGLVYAGGKFAFSDLSGTTAFFDPAGPTLGSGFTGQAVTDAVDFQGEVYAVRGTQIMRTTNFVDWTQTDIPSLTAESIVARGNTLVVAGNWYQFRLGVPQAEITANTLLLTRDAREQTITVTNTGNQRLFVGPLLLDNTTDFTLSNDTCQGNLNPGASCSAKVTFGGMADVVQTALHVPTNDPTRSTIDVAITGTPNRAPTAPVLRSPLNGATDVLQPLVFQFDPSTDADNDTIAYELFLCADPTFAACTPKAVSPAWLVLLLLPFVVARRQAWMLAALFAFASATACGPKRPTYHFSKDEELDPGPVGGSGELGGQTTYYWKVRASDGHGKHTDSAVFSFTTR